MELRLEFKKIKAMGFEIHVERTKGEITGLLVVPKHEMPNNLFAKFMDAVGEETDLPERAAGVVATAAVEEVFVQVIAGSMRP